MTERPPRLLSVRKAADYLGTSRTTLYELLKKSRDSDEPFLRCIVIGRRMKIAIDDLDRFIEEHRQ